MGFHWRRIFSAAADPYKRAPGPQHIYYIPGAPLIPINGLLGGVQGSFFIYFHCLFSFVFIFCLLRRWGGPDGSLGSRVALLVM